MANLNGQFLDSLTFYKGLINIGATVGGNLTSSLQSLTDGDNNNLPIQVGAGLVGINGGTINFTTGTNTRHVLSQFYTINNTGGTNTITGIIVNATETSITGTTHNLMDLQVGGVSQIKVGNSGILTMTNWIRQGTWNYGINGGSFLIYNNVNMFLVDSNRIIYGYNELRNTGSVIIGNGLSTTPSARLHVRGDGTNPIARFETSAGTAQMIIKSGGIINIPTLPTSSSGLSTGDLWNNAGVLSVA